MDPIPNMKRQALAFRMPETDENTSNHESVEEDDSFYELTLEEVKALYNDMLKQKAINDKLLPRSKREEEEKKLRAPSPSYNSTVIRVEFPDRTILQGEFKPDETIADVKEFVRDHIKESSGTLFELFTSPPKCILPEYSTLNDLKLVPAAKLYVGTRNGTQFHFQPGKTSVVTFDRAQSVANSVRKQPEDLVAPGPSHPDSSAPHVPPSDSSQADTSKKVPKWFKMKK